MSTLQDFLDAPFGATATQQETRARAFRLHREFGETWIVAEMDGTFDVFESEELVDGGFILDPPLSRPTSAREALALAWNIAHPVKEGQVIPAGAWVIARQGDGFTVGKNNYFDVTANDWDAENRRTLDPLPEPEPDWLDAPAVIARLEAGEAATEPEVWKPVGDGMYARAYHNEHNHWSDLRRVTPLWPKEAGQDEWCRAEHCTWRHWRSGSVPTHKRGADCPREEKGQDA